MEAECVLWGCLLYVRVNSDGMSDEHWGETLTRKIHFASGDQCLFWQPSKLTSCCEGWSAVLAQPLGGHADLPEDGTLCTMLHASLYQ